MADDGFHEIQLGRKQLFFAFIAATVFTVVVFLIGVWVGRDVRRPETEVVSDVPSADVTPDAPQPPTQVSPSDLDYTARLQTSGANPDAKAGEPAKPAEPPQPAADSGPPEPPAATKTPAAAPPADPTPAPPAAAPAKGGAVTLQVGAFGTRKPADTLMTRLKKKGYAAYVFTAPSGPSRFKVRVGPFADRAAADTASARLKKEEGLSPLVQR